MSSNQVECPGCQQGFRSEAGLEYHQGWTGHGDGAAARQAPQELSRYQAEVLDVIREALLETPPAAFPLGEITFMPLHAWANHPGTRQGCEKCERRSAAS